MRKNIFEIVRAHKQPLLEISRINELLHKDGGVYVADDSLAIFEKEVPTSAIKYIDDYLFKSWKQRGTYINCNEFELALGITVIP